MTPPMMKGVKTPMTMLSAPITTSNFKTARAASAAMPMTAAACLRSCVLRGAEGV